MTTLQKIVSVGDVVDGRTLDADDLSAMATGMIDSPVLCTSLSCLGKVTDTNIIGPDLTITLDVSDLATVTVINVEKSIGAICGTCRIITEPPNPWWVALP